MCVCVCIDFVWFYDGFVWYWYLVVVNVEGVWDVDDVDWLVVCGVLFFCDGCVVVVGEVGGLMWWFGCEFGDWIVYWCGGVWCVDLFFDFWVCVCWYYVCVDWYDCWLYDFLYVVVVFFVWLGCGWWVGVD